MNRLKSKSFFQCGPFNLSLEAKHQVQDILFNLYADFYTFKTKTCLPPCQIFEYKAFHRSYDAKSGKYFQFAYIFDERLYSGGYAMYLIFDQSVDLYKSNLVINTPALLTHLGGDIGFCKEVLWILFLIFSAFEYARRYCLKMK